MFPYCFTSAEPLPRLSTFFGVLPSSSIFDHLPLLLRFSGLEQPPVMLSDLLLLLSFPFVHLL